MLQSSFGSRLPTAAQAWLDRARAARRRPEASAVPDRADDGSAPVLARASFDALLGDGLQGGQGGDAQWISVLHVGIDRLGAINDRCGYDVGTAVLEATTRRLRDRTEGLVALCKVGGDEHALCVALSVEEARQVAAKLVAEFRHGIDVDRRRLSIGLSIGIVSSRWENASAALVRSAAIAMRSVKARGGTSYAVFDQESHARQQSDLVIARELRLAAAREQFKLMYQPKVEAAALQVTAVEALLRWEHPSLGKISPDVFIPIAERFGMMDLIGDWVMDQALGQAVLWREQGLYMRVAINVSGAQLQREDFASRLAQRLALHGLPPSRFTCEITESVAVAESPVARRSLMRLKSMGVHLSVDDFGTGYSCLSSLCRLPVHELKLDRSLVAEVGHSPSARVVVKSVVEMAHSLHLRVVAEGVETLHQRDQMLDAGCDELQGYCFAKPMDARAIAVWAGDHRGAIAQTFKPSLFDESPGATPDKDAGRR